jgi:hypothetical protein
MTRKELPSPALLRKLLRYEPDTGKIFWLERPAEMFPDARSCKIWNTRYSNKEALACVNNRGYKHGHVEYVKILAHRVTWAFIYGEWPSKQIDHINGDRLDNRIENLRQVTNQQNQKNRFKSKANKSGFNGVHRHYDGGKWVAAISVNGKSKHLGLFEKINDAVSARKKAEKTFGYSERHGE